MLIMVGLLVGGVPHGVARADGLDPAAGQLVPMTPVRVVDTSSNIGHTGKLAVGETFNLDMLGQAGLPSDAGAVQAVMLHVQTFNGTSPGGFFWVYPTGATRPTGATLSDNSDGTKDDNTVIVPLGTDGQVSFYNGSAATPVDLTADVQGYVTAAGATTAGATYSVITQTRLFDTSTGLGGKSTPLASGSPWTFHLTGASGVVPTAGVAAVVLNLGAKDASGDGYVAVGPSDASYTSAWPRTQAYTGNGSSQQMTVVQPGATGAITLYTNLASVNVFADVEGYYLSATAGGAGDVYVPVTPTRIVDTRSNLGITGALTRGRAVGGVLVTGIAGVPAGADAVAVTYTTLDGTGNGAVTAWTNGGPRPSTSTVDVMSTRREENLAYSHPNTSGNLTVYNSPGETTDLLMDVQGYFQSPNAPASPNNATVAIQGTSAYVDWTSPYSDGGSMITSYTVTWDTGSTTVSGTTATVSALTPGTNYTFTVAANNAVGSSPGATAAVLPAEPPTAVPAAGIASDAAGGEVSVEWQTPSSVNGDLPSSLTGYTVALWAGATQVQTSLPGPDDHETTFTSLTNGTSYYATVTASNRFGTSPTSTTASVIAGTPAPLEGAQTSPLDQALVVTWDAPETPPTSITVTATPHAGGVPVTSTVDGSVTTATVNGLQDDTDYDVVVAATDPLGTTTTALDDVSTPLSAEELATDGSTDTADTPASSSIVNMAGLGTPSFSTTLATADELATSESVDVLDSAAPGTATITGIVTDDLTGNPIAGATVTFNRSDGTGTSTTVQSDSNGLYAIYGIPAGTAGLDYDTVIAAAGYGSYTETSVPYLPDDSSVLTVSLTSSAQTESPTLAPSPQLAPALLPGTTAAPYYPSQTVVPATIKVEFMHSDHTDCSQTNETESGSKIFRWKNYILHVARGELPVTWPQITVRANFAAESTYAWYSMYHGKWRRLGKDYDVRNTVDDQCLDLKSADHIPSHWYTWVNEELGKRIAYSSTTSGPGDLDPAQFQASKNFPQGAWVASSPYSPSYPCPDYSENSDHLSQIGTYGMGIGSKGNCSSTVLSKINVWTDIDNFYYKGHVQTIAKAPTPSTTHSWTGQSLNLAFPSQIQQTDVGWSYSVYTTLTLTRSTGGVYTEVHHVCSTGTGSGNGSIPTTCTYSPPIDTAGSGKAACGVYHVTVSNPAGDRSRMFNGGNAICPP